MKIKRLLFNLIICAGLIAFGYQYQVGDKIINVYRQFSAVDTAPPKQTQVKAEVDLLLQQQSQKVLSPQPIEEALSDSEKLQKLDAALHELNTAADEYDRELAVMELGELQGLDAKQGLINALHDDANLVVTQAIRQINNWQDQAQRTDMLLMALQSPNDDIIEQTLLVLNVVEDKKLINRLRQLSKHHNPDIRQAAKLALNLAP